MIKKSCGNCRDFIKWKKDGEGLCNALDRRTKPDKGHKCKYWKGIKHTRKPLKILEDL